MKRHIVALDVVEGSPCYSLQIAFDLLDQTVGVGYIRFEKSMDTFEYVIDFHVVCNVEFMVLVRSVRLLLFLVLYCLTFLNNQLNLSLLGMNLFMRDYFLLFFLLFLLLWVKLVFLAQVNRVDDCLDFRLAHFFYIDWISLSFNWLQRYLFNFFYQQTIINMFRFCSHNFYTLFTFSFTTPLLDLYLMLFLLTQTCFWFFNATALQLHFNLLLLNLLPRRYFLFTLRHPTSLDLATEFLRDRKVNLSLWNISILLILKIYLQLLLRQLSF